MRSSFEIFRILNHQFHVLYAFTVLDLRLRQQGQPQHQKGVVEAQGDSMLSLRQAEGRRSRLAWRAVPFPHVPRSLS
jgi:hypothetical protein